MNDLCWLVSLLTTRINYKFCYSKHKYVRWLYFLKRISILFIILIILLVSRDQSIILCLGLRNISRRECVYHSSATKNLKILPITGIVVIYFGQIKQIVSPSYEATENLLRSMNVTIVIIQFCLFRNLFESEKLLSSNRN